MARLGSFSSSADGSEIFATSVFVVAAVSAVGAVEAGGGLGEKGGEEEEKEGDDEGGGGWRTRTRKIGTLRPRP